MSNLDTRIAELAAKYLPLAAEMLKEAIRIPADYVEKPVDQGGDPACGTSNHEFPRIDYLRKKIVAIKAVRKDEDAYFDDFGNLVWRVEDPNDGIPADQKKVVYIDGHTDTVKPLRAQWLQNTGGIDCFDGVIDAAKVNKEFLNKELGYLPPESEWNHLIFEDHLTLATNVFGTTFYSLVGLHASHVIIGLFLLTLVLVLSLLGKIPADHTEHIEMISWYWHFVDAIWVVVVTVVYMISIRF